MHPFRVAVEAGDVESAISVLSEDVEFRSPVLHKPYRGRDSVVPVLHAVASVFEDFRYERELCGEGNTHALLFTARIGDKLVEGCDFLRSDASGTVEELFVMVRPLTAAIALATAMEPLLSSQGTCRQGCSHGAVERR